ncbi:sulfotransferase [Bacillus piscicola]|uniref:sulfotransferase n=1 Tax=Bacillus piscicola TaxID=1632684 RepID=UPI001F09BAF7|nr:sulfotransferase [Bacillus piscicola]
MGSCGSNDILFICSMGHSGSTFLELLLTRDSCLEGLGEVGQTIEQLTINKKYLKSHICSCGQTGKDCEFWGPFLSRTSSEKEFYKEVTNKFNKMYSDKTLVDGSKQLVFLEKYNNYLESPKDIKVLFLVRDFRSWVVSEMNNRKRKGRKKQIYPWLAYKWLISNVQRLRYLKKNNIPFHIVSYERVVFELEEQLNAIYTFLELEENNRESYDLKSSNSHNIMGNRMRFDTKKREKISYDNHWFSDLRNLALAPILLPVYIFNSYIYKETKI